MIGTWSLDRGARVLGHGGVRFSVWAPRADRVAVVLHDGHGAERVHDFEPGDGGVFEATVPDARAGNDYRFRLDGARDLPDPVSRMQPDGVHGPSRVVDPAGFHWTDSAWPGREMADLAIYELHVGTYTPEGTFDDIIDRLPELRDLGVTAVELMPVAQFPGTRNWGYDGVDLYAPHSSYGGPEGLKRLVNAAHGAGLAVILDVVYNHIGPEGNYLGEFGPYFTDTYRTPWGAAINFDGAGSDEVRRFFTDNALYWVTEFHLDALRLDAVHGIYDFGARHILREIAHRVHEQGARLRRRVQVIAESDLNDPRLVRSPEAGGYGMDAQWSDDFHHAVHAALTGEKIGYYTDFGGVDVLARALGERFVYSGQHSRYRARRHGAPATDVPADHFVVCVQNHDQVGNRAAGDRLSTMLAPAEQRLAATLLLTSPYVPLLFMGEEYGETNPFQYFVSHGDGDLVEAVRAGRRKEFEAFGWGDNVPDPQAEETFERSRPDLNRRTEPGHRQLRTLYRDLLHLRQRERALRPGESSIRVGHDAACGWITVELVPSHGDTLIILFNLSTSERIVPLAGSETTTWTVVLSTEDIRYGDGEERRQSPMRVGSQQSGGRRVTPQHGDIAARTLVLPPLSAVLCRRETI
ncbi:MAG: malto-oligosyltrehalose trehalohydrolase [Gemmatimonadaceae bacterium]